MVRVISLRGRLDRAAPEALLPERRAACAYDLVLDGSAVGHIGAVGAQLLRLARACCESPGCGLRVTGLSDRAHNCLEDLGLARESMDTEASGPAP